MIPGDWSHRSRSWLYRHVPGDGTCPWEVKVVAGEHRDKGTVGLGGWWRWPLMEQMPWPRGGEIGVRGKLVGVMGVLYGSLLQRGGTGELGLNRGVAAATVLEMKKKEVSRPFTCTRGGLRGREGKLRC